MDDDDLYGPTYLERMVGAMVRHDASLCKLASFLHLDMVSRCTYLCDPSDPNGMWGAGGISMGAARLRERQAPPPMLVIENHGTRWGFGFSVVHTARLAAACPYRSVSFGEDYEMVAAAARAHFRCICFNTTVGDAVALHISHQGNSSCVHFGRLEVDGNEPAPAFDACFAKAPISSYDMRTFLSPPSLLVRSLGVNHAHADRSPGNFFGVRGGHIGRNMMLNGGTNRVESSVVRMLERADAAELGLGIADGALVGLES